MLIRKREAAKKVICLMAGPLEWGGDKGPAIKIFFPLKKSGGHYALGGVGGKALMARY